MRKFLSVALLSGLVLSGAYASDLLASVTNGAVSESSVGVHKLNTAEMANVKGGYTVGTDIYVFANMDSFAQVGKIITISEEEKAVGALSYYGSERGGSGYHARSRYQEAVSIANPDRGEHIAITVSLAKIPTYWGTPRLKFGYGAAVVRVAPNGSVSRVRSATLSSYLASDAMRHEKNTLARVLTTN